MVTDAAGGLVAVPLFAGLPAAVLARVAAVSLIRRYPAGQILFHEGDEGTGLIVVEQGQLRVSRLLESGQEAVLAVVEPPASLGELALLDGKPRDATVTAQTAVVVRVLPRVEFQSLLREQPAFVEGVLANLAGWVRFANERHADLIGLDVPGRLAKWLLARGERGGASFSLDRDQSALAAELGTTRSTLNRALHELIRLNAIAVDGERVTIVNADLLRAMRA